MGRQIQNFKIKFQLKSILNKYWNALKREVFDTKKKNHKKARQNIAVLLLWKLNDFFFSNIIFALGYYTHRVKKKQENFIFN